MPKELTAVIISDNSLELEWIETREEISKDQSMLQEELYKRYKSGPGWLLLYLAFCNNKINLNGSLDYFRAFAGLFGEKLRMNPDLDKLERKIK